MNKKIKIIIASSIVLGILSIFLPNTLSKYTTTISGTISFNTSRPQYTISFDRNGGTGSMDDMVIKRDVSQTLTANAFTRLGYDFIGWNTASDGSGISYTDEQEMAYASITDGEVITLYAQWLDKSYLSDIDELNNYSCTETVETFTIPTTGRYLLEAWGAQGGSISQNTYGTKTMNAYEGGRGGYSYGIASLNLDDKVYIAVGCEGQELLNAAQNTVEDGGYNGGGQALSDSEKSTQGSGGGATHFAINNNLGELENYSNNQSDILLVAGGGGGSYSSADIYYYSTGGFGGGLIAGYATAYYDTRYRALGLTNNKFIYYQGLHIPGATQTVQTNGEIYYGTFGQGADAIKNNTGTDAGAGGGWYGGNKLAKASSGGGMGGSGGSGHVNTDVLMEGKTIAGNLQVPTYDGSSYMTGNTGDGYARISYIKPHYTVKFNVNGGEGNMSDMNFTYGVAQNLTANAFTRNGCAFVKWNTKSDGTGTDYANGQSVTNLSSTYDDVINLYAMWECDVYFQLPPDWDGSSVYLHLFTDGANNSWPGYTTTLYDSTKNIYKYTLSQSDILAFDGIIFSNSSTRQSVNLELDSSNFGKVFVPELYNSSSSTRVLFSGSTSWTPSIYLWNSSTGANNSGFPGLQMSSKISGSGYSEIINRSQYNKMIFNKGKSGVGNQTDDLDVPTYQDLTYALAVTSGGKKSHTVTRRYYFGSWHDYDNWIDTGYTDWHNSDYNSFVSAQSAIGY